LSLSDQGKHPVYDLSPDGINDAHFIFTFGRFAFTIVPELAFHLNSRQGGHMKELFELHICPERKLHICPERNFAPGALVLKKVFKELLNAGFRCGSFQWWHPGSAMSRGNLLASIPVIVSKCILLWLES
jgi:hypothetical protein